MRNKLAFTIILLFSLITVSAQNNGVLTGTITDKEYGEPLIGANVYTKDNLTVGAVTDISGHFSIALSPGSYTFLISFTGMKTVTMPVTIVSGQITDISIEMESFSTQFDEVIITAGRFEKALEEQTASIQVMTPRLIEARNTRSVESILDLTPGVTILDEEPQIRGGSGFTFGVGAKVGVFIDDMPIITGDAGKPDWALIPIENIKQIEVTKGASSVLSGASALSGAIYIRTNFPGIQPITKVQLYTGMYTPPRSPATKWWSGVNYLGGASFLHTRQLGDGHTDLVVGGVAMVDRSYLGAPVPGPYVNDTAEISDNQMINRRGRFNFNLRRRPKKLEGLNFGLNGNVMYRKSSTVFAWQDDTANFYRGYPGAVLLADNISMYFDPYLNYYTPLGGKHTFTNRILYTDTEANNNQSNSALMIYNQYQYSKKFRHLSDLDFVTGLSSQYTHSNSNMYSSSGSPNNYIWNASLYMELEKKFGHAWIVSLGARIEHFRLNDTIIDTKPIFRFGTSLKVGKETYLRASIGQGYRFPTITERYIRTRVGAIGVFDNPELIPETSWNAEIGVKQGFKFSKFYGFFDAAIFYQEYNNTIEYLFGFWDYSFAIAGFKFVNTGSSKVTGIDVSVNGQAKFGRQSEINLLCGYTYVEPVSLEPNYVFATDDRGIEYSYYSTSVNPSKNLLKYRFLHTIKFDLEYNYKSFSIGTSIKYFSKIENLDNSIFEFENATIESGTMQPILYKNYYYNNNNGNIIFDARVSYVFRVHHKIALISNNLFNRWYSLRPLKAEPMRNITLQYTLNL